MTQSKNKVTRSRALQSWKSDCFLKLSLATDHRFLKQGTISKFERARLLIFGLVFGVT